MYYGNNNDAIDLGFNNIEEMILYHDVCGFDIVPTLDREELLERSNNDLKGRTKEDFNIYMTENNLMGLFDRVKDLSLVDRFIALYDNLNNELILSNFMLEKYNRLVKEASEIYDLEKEAEYREKSRNLFSKMQCINARKQELANYEILRLDSDDQVKFYNHTEEIEDYMQELKEKGRGRKQ